MPTCKSCGEPIKWLKTRAGKNMPVDEESLGHHTLGDGVMVVLDDGSVLRGTAGSTVSVYGYTAHWATCPFAETFRRR